MTHDEETQELPIAESELPEPPADLGPWGAEAVRLGLDGEQKPQRESGGTANPRPNRRRWATAGALGLASLLIGALVVTAVSPDNDRTARPPGPTNERGAPSAPSPPPPKPSPRRVKRDQDKAKRKPAKTSKPAARTRTSPAPSPTYPPSPAPQPLEPVTPSPAPAPTAPEPTPTSPPPSASGATVAKEFGFER